MKRRRIKIFLEKEGERYETWLTDDPEEFAHYVPRWLKKKRFNIWCEEDLSEEIKSKLYSTRRGRFSRCECGCISTAGSRKKKKGRRGGFNLSNGGIGKNV